MKLEEIKPKKSLAEECGGSYFINEILDTKIPVESWTTEGTRLIGLITIDDCQYRIRLEPFTFPVNNKLRNAVNVAFTKIINGKEEQYTTNDSGTTASKIIGAIMNGMKSKLDEYNFEAVTFAATNSVDQRMRIYGFIAARYGKQFGVTIPNIKIPNGLMTIITTSHLTDDEIEEVKKAVSK